MNIQYAIRLRDFRQLYVGKRGLSYSIKSDQYLAQRLPQSILVTDRLKLLSVALELDQWFVPMDTARMFGCKSAIHGLFALCTRREKSPGLTFSHYEIVEVETVQRNIVNADDFLKDKSN